MFNHLIPPTKYDIIKDGLNNDVKYLIGNDDIEIGDCKYLINDLILESKRIRNFKTIYDDRSN